MGRQREADEEFGNPQVSDDVEDVELLPQLGAGVRVAVEMFMLAFQSFLVFFRGAAAAQNELETYPAKAKAH